MDNTITVNGKTYTFPCTVTGEEARAIRDAAPMGMLEVVDPYNARWQQDLSCFNFASGEYQFRISPDWNLEEAQIVGTEEGEICNRDGCNGVLHFPLVEGCTCHVSPPCQSCLENDLCCPKCGWTLQEELEAAPTTLDGLEVEPAPKFPLTPAEAFRALADGKCVEMNGKVHRLRDGIECFTHRRWNTCDIFNTDFVNMRIVPDPTPREIALATGLHIVVEGERLEILDESRGFICYLKRSELREILNALEETPNE